MGTSDRQRLRAWVQHGSQCATAAAAQLRAAEAFRHHLAREWCGYVEALGGVAAVSLVIAIVARVVYVSTISLLYLFVVLYLARRYGHWPAVLASVLAFLAYDFLFIPPLYHFTVDDPSQWVSLAALLVTSLVLGELTAAVEARRREAVASQQRTATLYALAQLIASTRDEQSLLDALARRVVDTFAGSGVEACALILPQTDGGGDCPVANAVAWASGSALSAVDLTAMESKTAARDALGSGLSALGHVTACEDGLLRDVLWSYMALHSGELIVGVLGIAGGPGIQRLQVAPMPTRTSVTKPLSQEERRAMPRHHEAVASDIANELSDEPSPQDSAEGRAQATLFAAFCDQIALALERAGLRREAIHAEALRESDKLKTALLGSVTHDLRTPIAAIKAAADSLLAQGAEWSLDDRREMLASIDAGVDRLDRLVSNLLDLSRLEGGAAAPEKDWYPIGDVLATVLDRFELVAATRGHTLDIDVPPDLSLVPMDYRQIEEVFTNLIENAVKYSPDGSTIHIQAREMPSDNLEVRIADQGVGIPSTELEAIFDKFYRVQQVRLPWANRPPTGTGLGLAICAGIIRAHGGHIWAESIVGQGSTFVFTLPIPAQHPRGSLPEVGAANSATSPSATAYGSAATP